MMRGTLLGKRMQKLGAVYNRSNFTATATSTRSTAAWQTQDPAKQICSESSRSKQRNRKFSDSASEKRSRRRTPFTLLFHSSALWAQVGNPRCPSATATRARPMFPTMRGMLQLSKYRSLVPSMTKAVISRQPQPLRSGGELACESRRLAGGGNGRILTHTFSP